MKPIIEIDFETRSRIDIRKAGAGKYASDPSTEILCVCWAVDNGPVMGSVGEEVPRVFHQAIKEGWTFSGFNAIFEQLIWTYRWPAIPVPQFICTRALAAAHNLPQSLDRACKALHIGYAKDIEGKRLINAYSIPRKDGTFNELKGEDQKKMLQYCAKDVLLSRRIRQRLPGLLPGEQEVYDWTVKANIRGICIDSNLAEKAQDIASELEQRGNQELARITEKRIFSISQIQRIKTYLKDEFALETESLDKETIEEILLQKDIPDTARMVLQIRQDLAQSSVKKFARAASSVCEDGKVRDTLIYHGAGQTGRWAGQVVQFQNLPRKVVKDPENALRLIKLGDAELFSVCYDQPMQALSSCIRSLIVPQEGTMFAVVDYNAIEARGLVWAAGQEDAIYDFHNGVDRYLKMAETIYQRKGFNKKDHAKERFLGKTAVLGCGYQMGFIKFQATCEGYGIDLGERTEYVEKTNKEGKVTRTYYAPLAKAAVDAYRMEHQEVVKFWYDMQNAATKCVLTQEPAMCGKFSFYREREFLYLQLPSGRRIAYHKPGVDIDGLFYYAEDSQTNQYVKKRTYGGKLVENAIQGMCRDVLAHGILNLEKAGFPVLMTIHDENIVSIKSKEQIEEVSRIMCELPAWAKGFPVAAEGFVCSRYRKG